ncbi:MAG: riboflavin biosynthesis protein RibD [Treponema sp. CETP13]|nr:MAG: riboflavin biosynthesis protein RibD [Treponema sp. CETP13]
MTDTEYMKLAIALAKKGCGWVNPNPMVGAIVVKNDKIIGQGYHKKYGTLHAERNALANCKTSPEGATLYVTLEPCCHYGKTPPCTDAIIASKIKRVVFGSYDSNPLVAGKSSKILVENGISVTAGMLQKECDALNPIFFYYIQNKRPYVMMKYAMTMDGKIATRTNKSQWITGTKARSQVHKDRHKFSAIMVGLGTVLADDPLLTCRNKNSKNPTRIVCDSHLKIPLTSKIVKTTDLAPTIIATTITDIQIHQPYIHAGCQILVVPQKNGYIDLSCLMNKLGEINIDSVLLEGGATLNWSALQSGIVNKIQTYIAPKIFGGTAKSPVMGIGIDFPNKAFKLTKPKIIRFDEDILLESEVIKCLQE